MNILIFNTSDIQGGAARASYRLHRGLNKIGVDSKMLVQFKFSDDWTVFEPNTSRQKFMAQLRRQLDKLPLCKYPNRSQSMFSSAQVPWSGICKKIRHFEPDIVHLHWIGGGLLAIEDLKDISQPIVWTMHDMWAFTGGCHYDEGCSKYQQICGQCPVLGSSQKYDLANKVWRRKQKAWKNLNLTLVSPSRWLAECAAQSSLLSDYQIKVIPNGLDTEVFKPLDKQFARHVLGLPFDKKVLLFGALQATSDPRKGFQHLEKALQILPNFLKNSRDVIVVIFGVGEPRNKLEFPFLTHYLGRKSDDETLTLIYSAADVFIAPSTQDNLPNAIVEAMACACPCIGFQIGGLPDLIDSHENGYLARAYEAEDLAQGISWILADTDRIARLANNSRQKIEREYSLEVQAQRYAELYQSILDK